MSTKFLSPDWRMPRNANQSKQNNYSLHFTRSPLTRVHLGDALNFFIGSFSASMWIKSPDNGKEFFSRYISGNGVGNFRIGCGANSGATANTVSLMTKNILLSGSTDIRDGNWHHICVTMDAISSTQYTRTIYVDGSQDAQDTLALATYVSTSSSYGLNLGCNFQNNGHNTVDMSEVAIFDYALSASQVTTLHGNSTNGVGNPMALPRTPIAYYPLGTSAWNGQYLAENNAIGDYVFDFSGSLINSSSSINLGTVHTISYWGQVDYNASALSHSQSNISSGYIIQHSNYSNGTYGFRPQSTAGTTWGLSNQSVEDAITKSKNGEWVQFTLVRNGNDVSLYADGVFLQSVTVAWGAVDTIFSSLGGTGVCKYSNFLFWTTNLSSTEVETLYNYGSPIRTLANIPQNSNLKAWYKLDASEVYDSSTTEWEINQAQAPYQSSVFCPNVSGQVVTDYLEVSNYSGTTGKTAASWSFWYNASEANNQSGPLSGGVAQFKRNAGGQYAGQEFTLYTEVAGVNFTFSTRGERFGGRYMDMPAAGNNAGIQGIGDWVNIVLVYDGNDPAPDLVNGGFAPQSGSIRAYANGAQGFLPGTLNQYNGVYPAEGTIRTGSLIFGGGDFATRHMSASLSNYATWDKALTQAEVNEIVNNGQPKDLSTHSASSDLISWWTLENLTTGLVDTIGGYNASIVGSNSDVSSGSVSTLNGESSGMSQSNLVQSDLQTVAPYSKYAIEFDHTDADYIDLTSDINLGSTFSFSVWLKTDHVNNSGDLQNTWVKNITGGTGFFKYNDLFGQGLSDGRLSNYVGNTSGANGFALSTNPLNDNIWHHCFVTFDGSTLKSYIDGSLNATIEGITTWTSNILKKIGRYDTSAIRYFDGILSNMAVWNSDLTSSQAREVYNEGLPSDLNTFSGPAPTAWWQLGENSSYAGGWIFANEIGSINGEGQNLTEINLTNGVGTTANGVSTGMSEGNLVGDAPYSTANAISSGMAVTAKGTNVP